MSAGKAGPLETVVVEIEAMRSARPLAGANRSCGMTGTGPVLKKTWIASTGEDSVTLNVSRTRGALVDTEDRTH